MTTHPHAPRTLLALLLLLVAAAPSAASVVTEQEFDSPALGRKWSYTVYLPSGYEQSTLRYPVLYLLHGNGGNLNSWLRDGRIRPTADALIEAKEIPPTIIVMPDAGTTWFVDRKERMETAFIEDLIPEVQRRFRTLSRREGRIVAGLSMGGYGSMRFAMKYPELFAAAGLLSPAIYDPEPPPGSSARRVGVFGAPEFDGEIWRSLNYPALWEAYLQKKLPVPMYINSGDDDDYFIESEATRFYSLLRRHGLPAELRIVDGAHRWSVWASTVGDALRWLYRHASGPEGGEGDEGGEGAQDES